MLKTKITEFIKSKYDGSYRFLKEKMFIANFGQDSYNEVLNNTKFLEGTKYGFSVRVRSYVESVSSNPLCGTCGKPTIFDNNNGWQISCSRKCHTNSNTRKEKIRNTNLERYGATNYLASKEGRERIESTNLKKYGVTNYLASEEGRKQIIETNQRKYGVDNYAQTEEFKTKVKTGEINLNRNPEAISNSARLRYYNKLINGDIVIPLFSFEEYQGFSNPEHIYKWRCKKCSAEFESTIKNNRHLECRVCSPNTV